MFINGRFLTQRITGVQRFAGEIIQASAANGLWAKDATILAPSDGDLPASYSDVPVRRIGRHQGQRWEQQELAKAARDALLINLCNTAPLFLRRQLVVLHDAAIAATPGNFTLAFRTWYQLMIRSYGYFAARIGTVSAFSAGELTKYFGIPASKIDVIPESGEHILRVQPDYSLHEKLNLEQDGYFLAVSSLAPNKNFAAVLKAISRLPSLPLKFVIVGGRDTAVFNSSGMELSNAVDTGYVSDAQLRALYDRAACFVFPSLYEGFGLPPLEAMSCGCPVLVANSSSLPEVCGDAAVYCDPHDPDDIAQKLSRLLHSREARAELREAGLLRTRQWTWAKAAARMGEIIRHTQA